MLVNHKFLSQYYQELFNGENIGEILCRYSPTHKLAHVHIPKCCSKTLVAAFEETGYFQQLLLNEVPRNTKFLVFLREPVDRWYSGIVEYLSRANKLELIHDPFFCELLVRGVQFDDHQKRQTDYLRGLDTDNCLFFDCTHDVTDVFRKFMLETYDLDIWFTEKLAISPYKLKLKETVENMSSIDGISGLDWISNYYRPDYRLMSLINYIYTEIDYKIPSTSIV